MSVDNSHKDLSSSPSEESLRRKNYLFGPAVKPEAEYRYSLHRLVQSHMANLLTLGNGEQDLVQANSFSPTLYASMPGDGLRLRSDAFSFLHELISSLSQYPDQSYYESGFEPWHIGEAHHVTKVQALRTALSVARTIYSVAVVSRFEDYQHLKPVSDPRGFFEIYRIQMRWLIRKAFELDNQYREWDRQNNPADPEAGAGNSIGIVNSLYIDEIVWLYNECGVISLVQGNLRDAVALLRQALEVNERVEGRIEGGPNHNRISLNLAIAEIERGHPDAAAKRLSQVMDSEARFSGKSNSSILWYLARGYQGLVEHIRGDSEIAMQCYDEAIKYMRSVGDSRAIAIFCLHSGDLQRSLGKLESARDRLEESLRFAERGGYEDILRRARLAVLKLEFAEGVGEGGSAKLIARLGAIEKYAVIMEIPSLMCELRSFHADVLISLGETSLAGRQLTDAMAAAKRHDMRLRLNALMTKYARLLHLRGLTEPAISILYESLDLAKRNQSQLEIERVERMFQLFETESNPATAI